MSRLCIRWWPSLILLFASICVSEELDLQALKYNNPGLVVDLGVGLWAWPLPMDFDEDGDLDLVVVCPDKPSNGTYFFENRGETQRIGTQDITVFAAGRRIGRGRQNAQLSHVQGKPVVMTPAATYPQFKESGLDHPELLEIETDFHERVGSYSNKIRANQWKRVDLDADGATDLIVGIGDWSDYGWDDAYDQNGHWTHGPLHGFVYWLRNQGTDAKPEYSEPRKLVAADAPIDVYGWPSPCFADFDGDGDLDLMCGEFLDRFTYFRNDGSPTSPKFEAGRRPKTSRGELRMDLQMIVPAAIDWDGDGDVDLVVGDEDGRVAFIEHSGQFDADGTPVFEPPVYFKQHADQLKCGALSTPVCVDWDGDGDDDIVSGNTAGYVEFFENLGASGTESLPRFAAPVRLTTDSGETIRIQAGVNGSIQGPCEAKWGYTTLSVADWNHDGLLDIIINSIWGRIEWYQNRGSKGQPKLARAQPVKVDWGEYAGPKQPAWNWWQATPNELVTQWRTTPVVVDWNRDGLNDLVMLDSEGYLAFFPRLRRNDQLVVSAPQRIFVNAEDQQPLRLNERTAGGSGRRKIAIVDWNGDGQRDLLVNGKNADLWLQQQPSDDTNDSQQVVLALKGALAERFLSSHTTSPTFADWNKNGVPDLLVGAEDGLFYYLAR